jgi:hypothetical protein
MRNLVELGMNEGPRPVAAGKLIVRHPPTTQQISEFETAFHLRLPPDYIELLRFANGGHPRCCSFTTHGIRDKVCWDVNLFFFLNDDTSALTSLWRQTSEWHAHFATTEVPIADDPCSNVILLSYDTPVPNVKVYVLDGNRYLDVARTFGEFVDSLEMTSDA